MMRRRKFLGLFGAAATAPLIPTPAVAAGTARATTAAYSPAALHAAIYHAQGRAAFSIWGLARVVGISVEQAEVLMGDLAKRGIVGPLQGTTFGGRWASSRILSDHAIAARIAARRQTNLGPDAPRRAPVMETDLSAMLTYLRDMAATFHARTERLA